MKFMHFKKSALPTLGVELEIQLINPRTFGLVSKAKELLREIKFSEYQNRIKPEITQSMIEINSSIHHSPKEMLEELNLIRLFLTEKEANFNVSFCGGGTHPFQKWALQKIFPTPRYKKLARQYRYLSKRATVFGQHIHVGCESGEDALYLTHALTRYVPQLIAIGASSPFYQGVDTGYHSTRSTIFNAFPLSGVTPYLTTWEEFSAYFYKMKSFGIIQNMKDFYWDIRPKPEFGTVEIRVCDTPLTNKKAVVIAAYIQALAMYLLKERPDKLCQDAYYVYNYNRFQASRYGYGGLFTNPYTGKNCLISEDILGTVERIEHYANQMNTMGFVSQVVKDLINNENDATHLRKTFKQVDSFAKVVSKQCDLWKQAESF